MALDMMKGSDELRKDEFLDNLAHKFHMNDIIKEWKNLSKSEKYVELQNRLDKLNKDILIKFERDRQRGFVAKENEGVVDMARRLVFQYKENLGVLLHQLIRHNCNKEVVHAFKVDIAVYLTFSEQYELLCTHFDPRNISSELFGNRFHFPAAQVLHAACLDNTDKNRNRFIRSLLKDGDIGAVWVILRYGYMYDLSDPTEEYMRNYCGWLLFANKSHAYTLLGIFHENIYGMIIGNKTKRVRFFLDELVRQGLLLPEEQKKILRSQEFSWFGLSLFEWIMLQASPEAIEHILEIFGKEEVTELLTSCKDRWLVADLAVRERGDVIEIILKYLKDLTDDEKKEFHSQLVAGSLSQEMILLLREFASDYIIPEGTGGARKQALVYYNVKRREDGGENGGQEEAEGLISGLENLDFSVQSRRDWRAGTLEKNMKEDFQRVKDDCSVVVVFVMAHGSADEVFDADMKPVTPGYIDDIINSGIPKGIPKISIIDSCRKGVREPSKMERFTHLVSTRPQVKDPIYSQDYCRIMTAARGEVTRRNIMLPILIEEWKKGDEFKEEIIKRVRHRLKYHEDTDCRNNLTANEDSLDRKLYM